MWSQRDLHYDIMAFGYKRWFFIKRGLSFVLNCMTGPPRLSLQRLGFHLIFLINHSRVVDQFPNSRLFFSPLFFALNLFVYSRSSNWYCLEFVICAVKNSLNSTLLTPWLGQRSHRFKKIVRPFSYHLMGFFFLWQCLELHSSYLEYFLLLP